jgi:hypothetical protein
VAKSTDYFGIRTRYGKTGLQSWCKECKNSWDRDHYQNISTGRKREIKDRKYRIREEARAILCDYFAEHPCIDCGETDIVVLEFDHLGNKEFTISAAMQQGFSIDSIKKEINKCESVCCNCHRRRTAQRENSWRISLLKREIK